MWNVFNLRIYLHTHSSTEVSRTAFTSLVQKVKRDTVDLLVVNLSFLSFKKLEMMAKYWLMLALMSSMFTSDKITVHSSAYKIIENSWAGKKAEQYKY